MADFTIKQTVLTTHHKSHVLGYVRTRMPARPGVGRDLLCIALIASVEFHYNHEVVSNMGKSGHRWFCGYYRI